MCVISVGATAKDKPLFLDNGILEVLLDIPISKINAGRKNTPLKYVQGHIHWLNKTGIKQSLALKVRARGNYRRKNCKNPPLRLNFKKKIVKNTLFHGQDKLKLVRACGDSKRNHQWVVLEYLAYNSYLALTGESFRVRPIMLRYSDDKKKTEATPHFAFLIESADDVAKRNRATIFQKNRTTRSALDPATFARVGLFQYMIGNNDYSLLRSRPGEKCCHNMRLLIHNEPFPLSPFPYDFDSSGMIDADYAMPPERLKIRSVRTRRFRGLCTTNIIWRQMIGLFNEKRQVIYRDYQTSPYLSQHFRDKSIDYLDSFYEILNDEKKFKNRITSKCR